MTTRTRTYRAPLLLLAVLALLAAMWAGLLRLAWDWPVLHPTLPVSHGPLMVSGFFGTLISLERAVALRARWFYLGPLASGLGGLLLAVGVPGLPGPLLLTFGSFWLLVIFGYILRQHMAAYTLVMALGALCWLVGSVLWLSGWPVSHFVLWWLGFLVLTIAGERLELSRVTRLTRRSQQLFLAATAVFLLGLLILFWSFDWGVRVAGVGFLALAAWLLRYDIARRTVRLKGLTRFIAVCLLSGYLWLVVAGVVGVVYGGVPAGPAYDALLHAVSLGFVFAMVFGHAPIIFPAVLNLTVEYRPVFYLPLAVLHASLLLRIAGGLAGFFWARHWGGLFNAIAVLLYLGIMIAGQISGRLKNVGESA